MTHSVYKLAIDNAKLPADLFFEKLEEAVPGLFDGAMSLGGEGAKLAALFIIHAYSKESPMVVLGADTKIQKRMIADKVNLPDTLNGPVVEFQNASIRQNIIDYLEYQSDREWKHYMINLDLNEKLRDAAFTGIYAENGDVDGKGVVEGAKHRKELLKEIRADEEMFKERFGFVIEGKKEIRAASGKGGGGNSLRIEDMI